MIPYLVSEAAWRGDDCPPGGSPRRAPAPGVELHHSVTPAVASPAGLISTARAIYRDHVDRRGWSDVFYGFLVGRDGGVLIARGWDRLSGSLEPVVVCLVGNYDTDTVTDAQAATVAELRRLAHDKHQAGLELRWHRQRDATACPGAHVIADIAAGRFTIPQPTPPPAPPVPTPEPIDMQNLIVLSGDNNDDLARTDWYVWNTVTGTITGLGHASASNLRAAGAAYAHLASSDIRNLGG